jgi:hypothetical protein
VPDGDGGFPAFPNTSKVGKRRGPASLKGTSNVPT